MLFNSYVFIFAFLPVTLLGYYLIPKSRAQLLFLLICSLFFYAYWSAAYVFLLIFTVVLDFFIAGAIFRAHTLAKKRVLLLISVCTNLSILGFFKYYGWLASSINAFLSMVLGHGGALGTVASPVVASGYLPVVNLILPIGISFYTFQSMSYVIDVYRGHSDAHASLLSFAGYVTLFPHQISGPLVRHNQIVPQLENRQTYIFNVENFWKGITFFILGLSKKLLIADLLSPVVSDFVLNIHTISFLEAWLGMLGYAFQIYFDFSGYSDMAVGLGLMMNIQFPQNFDSPYKSKSLTEFWRRWHITLSSWLRDYLYISLGGNRRGLARTYYNLFVTMVLGGLWHGANWTFLIWGFIHGAFLAVERFFKNLRGGAEVLVPRFIKEIVVFFIVCVAWIFFRSPDFGTAFIWLKKIFFMSTKSSSFGGVGLGPWSLSTIEPRYQGRFFAAFGVALILCFLTKNTWEKDFHPRLGLAVVLGFLFAVCLMYMGEKSPFLYFQF